MYLPDVGFGGPRQRLVRRINGTFIIDALQIRVRTSFPGFTHHMFRGISSAACRDAADSSEFEYQRWADSTLAPASRVP